MVEHWRGKGYIGAVVVAHREKWIVVAWDKKTRVITALRLRDLETKVSWKNPPFMQWEK